MRVVSFDELAEYLPPGHDGVVNRLLLGRSNGGDGTVSVWHGRLDPGGHSDLHTHDDSLQIYVGLEGEMTVGDGERETTLVGLSTAVFQAGEPHFIENRSAGPAEVLVISIPGLR